MERKEHWRAGDGVSSEIFMSARLRLGCQSRKPGPKRIDPQQRRKRRGRDTVLPTTFRDMANADNDTDAPVSPPFLYPRPFRKPPRCHFFGIPTRMGVKTHGRTSWTAGLSLTAHPRLVVLGCVGKQKIPHRSSNACTEQRHKIY